MGADANAVNKFSSTPLHVATRMGHIEVVRALLQGGADVNAAGFARITALTIAAACNHLPIARMLLERGARIADRALLFAAMHEEGGGEMSRMLLSHGADVNGADEYGNTALMQASAVGNEEAVRVLVAREWRPRVEMDRQNRFGWSALHFAYAGGGRDTDQERRRAEIIRVLLEKGASGKVKNDEGKVPREMERDEEEDDGLWESRRKRRRVNGGKEVEMEKKQKIEPQSICRLAVNLMREFNEEEEEEEEGEEEHVPIVLRVCG